MHAYSAIFDIFRKYNILYFFYSIYFCLVIYFNGIEAFNKNTIAATYVRRTTYSPRVMAKMCYLKPDEGPCRGKINMYYFDSGSMNCSTFQWGGCQGNGNRFDSRTSCVRTCMSSPNPPKSRPKWCALTFDYGYCFGAVDRYYYDPVWKVCKKTIYSGCGGNKNNFYSLEQCEWVCRFGNGWLTVATKSDKGGMKKVLIVNPIPTEAQPCKDNTTNHKQK